jgi:uncharacterized protein YggE
MEEQSRKQSLSIKVDLRVVCLLLVLVIAGMFAVWRPWVVSATSTRKITITGDATIKSEPDEFQFSPYYERKTSDEITALSKQINDKLTALGVDATDIKSSASNSGFSGVMIAPNPGPVTQDQLSMSLTITAHTKDMAQKIQDYLLTTSPKGSITPYPSFSKDKQKVLEKDARGKAIDDAKSKAEQTASGLGAKVGKVIEVQEGGSGGMGCGSGIACPIAYDSVTTGTSGTVTKSLPVQAGTDEYSYSVTVVFELR